MNMNKYIMTQCRTILSQHFIDISKFTFSIDLDGNKYYVYAKRNGKIYFEVSDIYVDNEYKIIQYCVNWM